MVAIGFIGPGIMGAPMISNLVQAGHEVRALGRSDESWRRVDAAGAERATGLAELADDAEVVISMLPDSPDVQAIALGGDKTTDKPLASLMDAGQVFIDMSTILPSVSREIAAALAARAVDALDAPVSGGEAAAVEGTLSIMVGGEADVLKRVRPVLEVLGSTITHVGPAGSGQLTKAANQLIVATNIQAVAEAIVFLESAGVDLEAALSAIGEGLAGSTVLQRKREAFLNSDFRPGFRIALHDKDLDIVTEAMREQHVALPLTAVVSQLVTALRARGGGNLDHSGLLQLARDLNTTTA